MDSQAKHPESTHITINNIEFDRVLTNTIERELYWSELLLKGGISEIKSKDGESRESFTRRVTDEVKRSSVFAELLAMQISFAGEPWSQETQQTIAFFLTHLRGFDDLSVLMGLAKSMAEELRASRAYEFIVDSDD